MERLPPRRSGFIPRTLTMPVKFHSEPIESRTADVDEASTSATSTLRIMLMDASAELAQSRSDDTNWGRNYVRVAHWIARQVPLWRELVSKNRAVQEDPDAPTALEVDSALKLIDGFLTDLSTRAPQAVRDRERHAAIEKAKQEWECTADALTAMVCLLDADGLILRANRVVEHWGLGSVGASSASRRTPCCIPTCTHANCRVRAMAA